MAALRADIERARREPSGHLKPGARRKSLEEEAAWWRERLASGDPQAREELAEAMEERRGDPVGEDASPGAAGPEYLYDPQREREADTIYGLATGERVPTDLHLDRFLASKAASASYDSRVRRAVRSLGSWLKAQPEGDNLRVVGRKCAAAFIDHLAARVRDAATLRSLVSALSSYWSWLKRRGELAGDNPWQGQDLPKSRKGQDDKRRAFTDDEVRTLLSGETTRTLHDLMRLAALSGMRLNEIGRLAVADCRDGVFVVNRSKTAAGVRRVPIHPDLAALVDRRSLGREPEARLLEELKAAPSHPDAPARKAAERFTAYRRALGVGDSADERTQSRAVFHSFRRWFITAALRAGQPPHLVSAVAGHEEGREGMTLSVYDAGPSDAQLLAVVEAVCLPPGTPVESPPGPLLGEGRRVSSRTQGAGA